MPNRWICLWISSANDSVALAKQTGVLSRLLLPPMFATNGSSGQVLIIAPVATFEKWVADCNQIWRARSASCVDAKVLYDLGLLRARLPFGTALAGMPGKGPAEVKLVGWVRRAAGTIIHSRQVTGLAVQPDHPAFY